MNILGTSPIYLMHIHSKSFVYLRFISNMYMADISHAYPRNISGISQTYPSIVRIKSQAYLICILCIYIRQISGISLGYTMVSLK